MEKKVAMYIDGFNFYYAIKKQLPDDLIGLGWCNFRKLAVPPMLQTGESLGQIKYFTAPVGRLENAYGEKKRQQLWLDAVLSIENLKEIDGRHQKIDEHHQEIDERHQKKDREKRKEKMTDVNIAVELLLDAVEENAHQKAIIISGDLDLHPAADAVVNRIKKPIEVEFWFPPRVEAYQLKKHCATSGIKCHQITESMLFQSRLPDVIKRNGETITIDPKWRISKDVIRRHKDLLYGENATEMPTRAETL